MSLSTADETGGTNTLVIGNSILGDTPKNVCDTPATSPVVSRGGNLDPGVTCDLTESTDLENANPQLDKLATNLGVPTHALKSNSPAIDHGVFARCEPLDERNADRVDGPPANPPATKDEVVRLGLVRVRLGSRRRRRSLRRRSPRRRESSRGPGPGGRGSRPDSRPSGSGRGRA